MVTIKHSTVYIDTDETMGKWLSSAPCISGNENQIFLYIIYISPLEMRFQKLMF